MFEDLQYYFNKEQPPIVKDSSKPQNDFQATNSEIIHDSKESIKVNPEEEIEEGPTLALFCLSNTRFKNMTNLNNLKREKKNSADSVYEEVEEDELEKSVEETDQLKKQSTINESKHAVDADDIFFQTEVIYIENELSDIPFKNKSHSSVQPTQVGDSPAPLIKSGQSNVQEMLQSLKDYNKVMRGSDLIGKSDFRNSIQNTTKSTLFSKSPSSNLYFRNDSAQNQFKETNTNTLYKQKSTIVEESLGVSTNMQIVLLDDYQQFV